MSPSPNRSLFAFIPALRFTRAPARWMHTVQAYARCRKREELQCFSKPNTQNVYTLSPPRPDVCTDIQEASISPLRGASDCRGQDNSDRHHEPRGVEQMRLCLGIGRPRLWNEVASMSLSTVYEDLPKRHLLVNS